MMRFQMPYFSYGKAKEQWYCPGKIRKMEVAEQIIIFLQILYYYILIFI